MKKAHYIIAISLFYSLTLLSQVGIRTDYPQALFHIDGKGDNPNGALSEAQLANDVILSSSGKLGIGVLNPQKRVDILNDEAVTGLDHGLKLTPGYGGPSILTLEPDGITNKWEANPSLGKIGYFDGVIGQSFSFKNAQRLELSLVNGDISLTNGTEIRVPTEGRYLFTVTIIGLSNTNFDPFVGMTVLSMYLYLAKNDVLMDEIEMSDYYDQIGDDLMDAVEIYEPVNLPGDRIDNPAYMSFTSSLYAGYCMPTDFLTIRIAPSIGFSNNSVTPADDIFKITPDCKVMITIYNI